MNRFRVAMTVTTLISALAVFLLQPDNLAIWSDQKIAGVILGAIVIAAGIIDKALPSWVDSAKPQEGDSSWASSPLPPEAQSAARRANLPPRG